MTVSHRASFDRSARSGLNSRAILDWATVTVCDPVLGDGSSEILAVEGDKAVEPDEPALLDRRARSVIIRFDDAGHSVLVRDGYHPDGVDEDVREEAL